jgi:16S rRNA (guanine527-N7)-methyltransferase
VLSSLIRPNIRLLDIGTGAGFPGIPLKIHNPSIRLTAVDSVSKKIVFLRQLSRLLDLQNIECVASRIEPLATRSSCLPTAKQKKAKSATVPENSFDLIVSRAVGAIPYLLELAEPFLAPTGCILLQRGRNGKQEICNDTNFFQETGFQVMNTIEVNFSFFNYPRYLIMFRQIHPKRTKSKDKK